MDQQNNDAASQAQPSSIKADWEDVQMEKAPLQRVIITGINIPLIAMVGFLVKLAIAAVPAAIIVSLIWMILAAVFVGGLRW